MCHASIQWWSESQLPTTREPEHYLCLCSVCFSLPHSATSPLNRWPVSQMSCIHLSYVVCLGCYNKYHQEAGYHQTEANHAAPEFGLLDFIIVKTKFVLCICHPDCGICYNFFPCVLLALTLAVEGLIPHLTANFYWKFFPKVCIKQVLLNMKNGFCYKVG